MKFATKGLLLLAITGVLTGCQGSSVRNMQWFPAAKQLAQDGQINCVELKRQRLYNQTNINTETNNTTAAQRQVLDDLINKNCK